MADITITREQRLAEQEAVIDAGKHTFLAVGRALLVIRDEKLYKPEYKRFEDYCRQRHGFTRKNASETINAMLAVDGLLPIGNTISKDAALELGKVEDKTERLAVFMAAKRLNSNVTAPNIRSAINVLETAKVTGGFVDTGDGKMTPLDAALAQEVSDKKKRQQDYIRGDYKSENWLNKSCTLQQACEAMAELALRCGDQTIVKVLVYSNAPKTSEVQS